MNGRPLEELLGKFIAYLEVEKSASPFTMRNYTSDIRGFFEFLKEEGVQSLAEVDRYVLRGYLASLMEQGIVRASITRKLSGIRSFYRYLLREKLVSADPVASISLPKREKRLPSFLTVEEISRLLEAPDTSTPRGQRDRAILELFYASGLRVSEIVRLDLRSVNPKSREVRVWGKGSKERVVLMGRPAAAALERYLRRGRRELVGDKKSLAIFVNRNGGRLTERAVQMAVRKYARQAGLDMRVFPHLLRHTFATLLLDGGADLRVVQELLGHEKLSSTEIYTHVSQGQVRRVYLDAFYNQPGEDEGKNRGKGAGPTQPWRRK